MSTAVATEDTRRTGIRVANGELQTTDDDDTLIEDRIPTKDDRITIEDWSQTGRGSHVNFSFDETVPIRQDRFLGRGAMGDVYETTVQGWKLAHKRIVVKRKIGKSEKEEIEILKRLSSHTHMIQLVGTYTHRQFLGILLYPVAVCDLHTFFEDVEAWTSTRTEDNTTESRSQALDPLHKERLKALSYDFPGTNDRFCASPAYSKVGCLVSAIAYLHDQKIRHKDLKPSNILLSRDRLWLSDFGSATDFSLLSQSATDNERGTPRYFSPEVAAWQPNGRAADIFSLGCILLEILVLHERGSLEHIRQNRSPDPAFHANLDQFETWRELIADAQFQSRRHFLLEEIRFMLSREPEARPLAKQLLTRVTAYDISTVSRLSLFGDCCKNMLISKKEHEMILDKNKINLERLRQARRDLEKEKVNSATLLASRDAVHKRERDCRHVLNIRERKVASLREEVKELRLDAKIVGPIWIEKLLHGDDRESAWTQEKTDLLHRIAELEGRYGSEKPRTLPISTAESRPSAHPVSSTRSVGAYSMGKSESRGSSSVSESQDRSNKLDLDLTAGSEPVAEELYERRSGASERGGGDEPASRRSPKSAVISVPQPLVTTKGERPERKKVIKGPKWAVSALKMAVGKPRVYVPPKRPSRDDSDWDFATN